MRTLEITLNHLPPAELNPNNLRRTHWAVRYKASEEAKDEIGWMAKAGIRQHCEKFGEDFKPMMRARISYEFHSKDHRRRDLDNLLSACKAYQDGLIEVGVLLYDDAAHLEIGSVRAVIDGCEKTIIRVEEL